MQQYFIVRHDLEAFRAMPGFIWKPGLPEEMPRGFGKVAEGDRWIEFAYIKDEESGKPHSISMVTGFYECTKTHWYGRIPLEEGALDDDWWETEKAEAFKKYYEGRNAHMIQGKRCEGYQPRHPVTVPSIYQMLGKHIQPYATVAWIDSGDFEIIREETRARELDVCKIPLLEREPLNEQELLSVVVWGHEKLGIEKIVKVQCRFPDMLVRIDGEEVYLELEVDSLGFQDHIDKNQVRRIREGELKGKLVAKVTDKDDQRPVAVLCWVDGDREHTLKERVPDLQIFELQSLLRDERKLTWQPHGHPDAAGHLGE